MKLTLEKKETIVVDIDLPAYKLHGVGYYAILGENNWLRVEVPGVFNETSVTVYKKMPAYGAHVLTNGSDISEQEFWQKWNEALEGVKMEAAPCV